VPFRDETEALRARVTALEEENEELRAQLEEKNEVKPAPKVEKKPVVQSEAGEIAALVAQREAKALDAKTKKERNEQLARERRAARYARRPIRVSVERSEGESRIALGRELVRDRILEQAAWGYFFILVNPGWLAVVVLSFLFSTITSHFVVAGIVTWAVLLAVLNWLWALVMRPRYTLVLTRDGHFVVRGGFLHRVKMLGRTKDLRMRVSDPNVAELGAFDLEHQDDSVRIERLTSRDLEALREVLPQRS